MEASEDDPSEDNTGQDITFVGDYEDSKPSENYVRGRSPGVSPIRSEKSSWSSRSRQDLLENEEAEYQDYRVVSQSLQSGSRGSSGRERNLMTHQQRRRRFNASSEDAYDVDGSSGGEESQEGQVMSSMEGAADEETGEETAMETSCEEISCNNSIYSYKETGSSSELSIDPVVWKKFKFLSSILKETQHNLRAMDDLILEHHRLQGQAAIPPLPPHAQHQGQGEGEAKTDEAKLEEILNLLHNLTHTLSSYEQHPLLASTPHLPAITTASHSAAETHHLQGPGKLETDTRDLSVSQSYPTLQEATAHPSHSQHLLPTGHHPFSPSEDAKFSETYGRKTTSQTTSTVYSNGIAQSFHATPNFTHSDVRPQEHQQRSPRDTHSHISHYSLNSRNTDHALPSGIPESPRVYKKDTINQTDPFLLVPRGSEECLPPTDAFTFQTAMTTHQPESFHTQESFHHPLMKETRSLRKEIDIIMARKQALDTRLQSLIAHRAMQKEMEEIQTEKPKRRHSLLTKSKSLEDSELQKPKVRHRRYKTRSKSYEEERHHKQQDRQGLQETYLSMINENQDEFPSLTMESLDNEEKITELQTDEADIPGLGDSGLSSEINSINATIQELVRENQQLHKFLQGMTCESILKVDQEKLALEARIQALDKENESLMVSLKPEGQESSSDKVKQTGKGVKFCISEEIGETDDSQLKNNNMKRGKVTRKHEEYDPNSETLTLSPKSEGIIQNSSGNDNETSSTRGEALINTSYPSSEHMHSVSFLRAEVERLTKQNQQLVNIIEKEKNVELGKGESPMTLKSQNINKDVQDDIKCESSSTKEIEKLQHRIRKLNEEKEILEFKLSREASERDFESTRLEARIQILSDQNQDLTQKLEKSSPVNRIRYAETSCQTDIISHKSDSIITGTGKDKEHNTAGGKNIDVASPTMKQAKKRPEHIHNLSNKLATTTSNKVSPTNGNRPLSLKTEVDDCLNKSFKMHNGSVALPDDSSMCSSHLKEFPFDRIVSEKRSSTDDDKIGLINTPREDRRASHNSQECSTPCHVLSSEVCVSESSASGEVWETERSVTVAPESVSRSNEGSSGSNSKHASQMHQLEALVNQNKMIASSLNDLKSLSRASESSRESAFIRIMEENVRVMQSIGEKLASSQVSHNTELDARVTSLARENEELKSAIEQKQRKVERLINQNSSLEMKLHIAQQKYGKERKDKKSTGSDSSQVENDTQNVEGTELNLRTRAKISEDILSDHSVSSSSVASNKNHSFENSRTLVLEGRKSPKPSPQDQVLPPLRVPTSQQGTDSPSLDQVGNRSKLDSSQQNGSAETPSSNRRGSLNSVMGKEGREKNRASKRGSEVLDPETERLLDLALRKEKENRMLILEEAEKEKQLLQERIVTLVRENDCLAARLEEVVSVSRNLSGHMNTVKDQLERVEAEKNHLHKKVRSLEDGREDSSLSVSESIGNSRLTRRLKEQIRNLQDEVEKAWQEVHQRTVERDKVAAEKESLEYTSSIAINTARKEVEKLREQMSDLQEEKDKLSLEQTNLKNEIERKYVIAKAAQDDQISHLEKLREAERRCEALQIEVKRAEENLLKETLARKSSEAELEESRTRRNASTSQEPEGDKRASGVEQHWASTVAQLRNQLHQEQLHARLLEAGELESSARVLSLQRDIRDAREANQLLQEKYNQLRAAYKAKKAEKSHQQELSQLYTTQLKEFNKTSAALEENFKVMLCSLGENIEVTVELLTSHVFLTPCLVHPGPDIHQDPEAWFGAQQGRLRWLQDQLRKLCLHNWKTGNLPKTSNLDSSHIESFSMGIHSPSAHGKSKGVTGRSGQRDALNLSKTQKSGIKMDMLSELCIIDDSRSYASTPVKRSRASGFLSSATSSPSKSSTEAKHETPEALYHQGDSKTVVTHTSRIVLPETQSTHSRGPLQSSKYLDEAERILTNQLKELSDTKSRQYRALMQSLQRDLDNSIIPSPSIPSSLFTTPEKKVRVNSQDSMEENEEDCLNSDVCQTEAPSPQAVSPRASVSPSVAESSMQTQSLSGNNSIKSELLVPLETQSNQNLLEKAVSDIVDSPKLEKEKNICLGEQGDRINKENSEQPSVSSHIKSSMKEEEVAMVRPSDLERPMSGLKEKLVICGLDVDKDKDSWEGEDIIRMLVYNELSLHQE